MKILRVDPYKTYRSACFLLGFAMPIVPFAILVQHKIYSVRDLALSVLVVIATPIAVLVHYYGEYLMLDNGRLLISKVFWKEAIQVSEIRTLSYEFTGMALMLFVHYERHKVMKWKRFVVDFMSTANIQALHVGLLAVNPSIEVRTDKLSQAAQDRNTRNLRRVPTTRFGWLGFMAKWLCIGTAAQLMLLLMFVPRK